MNTSRPILSAASASAFPDPPDTVEALLCDGCRCPIGSLWDVLPAEPAVPAWKEHVYSYELDLFVNGSPPIQAYSATNAGARRFDLLRLAPHVTVHRVAASGSAAPPSGVDDCRPCNVGASATAAAAVDAKKCEGRMQVEGVSTARAGPADAIGTRGFAFTTLHAPAFVECDTSVYSSEHSFFSGYAWCFCHCSNCGAFLGWGFAAEDRLRAARRLRRGDRSGSASETGDGSRARAKGAREEEEEMGSDATETATAAAAGGSQPAESSSTSVALTAPLDQRQRPPRGPSDDGSDEYASVTALNNRSSSAIGGSSGAGRAGHEHTHTGVAPDFIGIIITHCTGEPAYPIASLIREVEWRAARQRRRVRVEALTRRLGALLPQLRDSYRAHEIYHDYHAVRQLLYAAPLALSPEASGGSAAASAALLSDVDEDGVPARMHAAVEAARIAVARQMSSDSGRHSSSRNGDSPS
ncbi:hypothetical protein JIQ42_06851 [Leishmania sp. Namibia]|uniref:hypothetical protein n=1 Tax=Leishmania sp. Namibia TaxID=2802991 RepID=UPI001B701EFD|nr:hypothetical protein JIQ42_06789 [Leishmania sp. Namibia]KAG5506599.1 hypothetical protein JIQ42_06851 [Leishmania sp. Namibia]